MKFPRLATALAAALSALWLSACAGGGATSSTTPPAPSGPPPAAGPGQGPAAQTAAAPQPVKPMPITIGYPVLGSGTVPLWLAEHAGLYKKYGLDAKLVYISGSSKDVQALLGGSVEVISSGPAAVNANLEGADLVFLAAPTNKFHFAVVSQPEIKSLQELKGKKIGVTRLGSGTDFSLRFVLSENGIGEKEVTVLQTGGMPETIAGLASKQLAAGVLSAPNIQQAEAMGFKVLFNMKDLKQDYLQGAVVTRKKIARENPELIRRFMKAYVEALYLFKSDRKLTEEVIAKYAKISDAKVVGLSYDYLSAVVTVPPYVKPSAVQTILRETMEKGRKVSLQPQDMLDMSFLDELKAAGFFDQMAKAHPARGG